MKNKENRLPRFFESKTIHKILWILFLTGGLYQGIIPAPFRNEYFGLLATGQIIGIVSHRSPFKFKNSLWGKLSKVSYQIYVFHILAIILISEIFRVII